MMTPKKMPPVEEENLLQVFENGTILVAVNDIESGCAASNEITGSGQSVRRISDLSLNRSISINIASDASLNALNSSSVSADQEISENSVMLERTNSLSNQHIDSTPITTEILAAASPQSEILNSSDSCSYDSRTSRKMRRKLRKYHQQPTEIFTNHFPPPYTTIYLDPTSNPAALMQSSALNQIRSFEGGGHLALSVPVIRRSHGEIMPKGCCAKWFARPSLPFVIGILALGGVACTLGGIVLGSTGLVEHSTQYLSAALLMIGIGVSLLVISGAIWRLSIPDDTETCPCFRPNVTTCQNCNSPYCSNRIISGAYIYPEFQHRPPPPSYLTSLHECGAVRVFLPEQLPTTGTTPQLSDALRNVSPPPSYRSCSVNSLSVVVPIATIPELSDAGSSDRSASNESYMTFAQKDAGTSS